MSQMNPNQRDRAVAQTCGDSISQIKFSPQPHSQQSSFLAGGSWDSKIYCWDISNQGGSQFKSQMQLQSPVLSVDWTSDGRKVIAGCGDSTIRVWDLQSNQVQQIGKHAAPVKQVKWIPEMKLLVSGGWDKTIKYWDMRQPNPASSITLPERVYCLDAVHPVLVVGCASRHIVVYNLQNPQTPFQSKISALKFQTRTCAVIPAKTQQRQGYALGSIEGRVAIRYLDDQAGHKKKSFGFKCHREAGRQQTIDRKRRFVHPTYAVNSLSFHRQYGSLATVGSDGSYHIWDIEAKSKLAEFQRLQSPLVSSDFNATHSIFAYAASYDWSQGMGGYNQQLPNQIWLHGVDQKEVRPKNAGNTRMY